MFRASLRKGRDINEMKFIYQLSTLRGLKAAYTIISDVKGTRLREIAQLMKCLLSKHKDLNLDLWY